MWDGKELRLPPRRAWPSLLGSSFLRRAVRNKLGHREQWSRAPRFRVASRGLSPRCTSGLAGKELRPASVAATLPSEKLHHCRYHVEVVDVHHGTARCSTADGHAYELVPLGRLKDMGDRRRRVPGVAGRDRFPGVVGDGARDWRPAWLGHFSVIVKEGQNY